MKEIILKVLKKFSCNDSGQSRQINLQSEAAQQMIADALEVELNKYVQQLVEDIVTPANRDLYPPSPKNTVH